MKKISCRWINIVLMMAGLLTLCGCAQREKEFAVSFANEIAQVGDELQAVVTGAKGEVTYQWMSGNTILDCKEASFKLTEKYAEKAVTVRVTCGEKKAEATMMISTLPVLYVTTHDKMQPGDNYEKGTLCVQGSSLLPLQEKTGYDGDIEIKLRGNSTRTREKKPYHVKLSARTNLLGLGNNKHWLLLAEDIDHTLLRNQLVQRFAEQLGIEGSCHGTSVSLVLNGKYCGVYTLCEQVRIGEDEVDIFDWEELAEKLAGELVIADAIENGTLKSRDKKLGRKEILAKAGLTAAAEELERQLQENYSWASAPYQYTYNGRQYLLTDYAKIPELTGGWMLEMDFYHNSSLKDSVRTAFLQNYYITEPSALCTNAEAKAYARKYIQTFEYALHSEDFTYHEEAAHQRAEQNGSFFDWGTGIWHGSVVNAKYSDPEHDGYRYDELFDMDSLVNYFLVCEFTRNWDSMKNSVFLYKDIDGLAIMGPCWDYDWAFGNINMYWIDTNYPTGWQTTDYYFTNENYYQNFNWNRYLIRDKRFVTALYERYRAIRETVIEDYISEDGWLAGMMEQQRIAGEANDRLWSITYHQYGGEKYARACESLKSFLRKRVAWLDEQFRDVDTLYHSLNSYEQAEPMFR